jgi:hypothetical protein
MRLPGARGLVVGRAPLYPSDGDVAAAVDRAVALVDRRPVPAGHGPIPSSAAS